MGVAPAEGSGDRFDESGESVIGCPFIVGNKINIMMEGAGVTTILGDTGVIINGVSAGSVVINNQYQGATITKNLKLSFHAIRIQANEEIIIECEKYLNFTEDKLFIEDIINKFEGRLQKKCIVAINSNPNLLTKLGKVNIEAIARTIDEPLHRVRKAIKEIGEFVKIY